jgi:hypothetical protein
LLLLLARSSTRAKSAVVREQQLDAGEERCVELERAALLEGELAAAGRAAHSLDSLP